RPHRHCHDQKTKHSFPSSISTGGTPTGCRSAASGPDEVNEAALDVGHDELDAEFSPDLQPLETVDELALDRRIEDPDPGALLRSAGPDGVEVLADPVLEEHRRGRLAHLAFDLVRVVFLLGAVTGELLELRVRVRRRATGERGLDEALRDEIGVASVRGGRMRVILDR